MSFNNQNASDELATKLLLLLPMVPKAHIDQIKLNHLKLYHLPGTSHLLSPTEAYPAIPELTGEIEGQAQARD